MPQIAQQNYIFVTADEEYYIRNKYPLRLTSGDVRMEIIKFLLYKYWKMGVFYDLIFVERIPIDDGNFDEMYLPPSLYYVTVKHNKAGEIIGFTFETNRQTLELSKSDIERYDKAIEYEQQIPNEAE